MLPDTIKPLHLFAMAFLVGTLAAFIAATEPTNSDDGAYQATFPERPLAEAAKLLPQNSNASTQHVLTPSQPVDDTQWNLAHLIKNSRISHEWLAQRGFLNGSVALSALSKLLAGTNVAIPHTAYRLTMAPSPNAIRDPELDVAHISNGERYVQTDLPASAIAGLDSVVIRWRSLETEFVQELSVQQIPINSTTTALPVWMFRPDGWPIGHYAVEVFAGNVGLEPIASGKFSIVPHGASVSPQAYAITRDIPY